MKKIKIAVAGASGKMGRRILALASQDAGLQIAGALERADAPELGTDAGTLIGQKTLGVKMTADPEEALSLSQVLIDFTHPTAVDEHLQAALRFKIGMVIGTTGLSEKTRASIKKASGRIPILQSPNMSTGVNFIFELVSRAAVLLDDRYDIEITETHHRMKKDAPSGTALEIARLIAEAKGWDPKKSFIFGRQGETGERKKNTIGIHALRGGDVVGEHTASFFANGEVIEITHRATSRDAFAAGALIAAKFVAGKKSGLYNMRQILCAVSGNG